MSTEIQKEPAAIAKLKDATWRDRFTRIAAPGINLDRMIALAGMAMVRDRKLLSVNPMTFIGAIFSCAGLGLYPNSSEKQAYLIPYGDSLELVISYQGYLTLVQRTGMVSNFQSACVYKSDDFDFTLGSSPSLTHRPNISVPRVDADIIGAYAVLHVNGERFPRIVVQSRDEILKRKGKRGGVWITHFPEMCQKTPTKRLCVSNPIERILSMAANIDDLSEIGKLDFAAIAESDNPDLVLDTLPQLERPTIGATDVSAALASAGAKNLNASVIDIPQVVTPVPSNNKVLDEPPSAGELFGE